MQRNGKRYLTPGSAARLLNCHAKTVRRMTERGEFAEVWRSKTGRIWVPADEVRKARKVRGDPE